MILEHRLQTSDDVCQWANFLFQRPTHQLDGASIETGTGKLSEIHEPLFSFVSVFNARQVDRHFLSAPKDLPGGVGLQGNFQFAREDVDGAKGKNSKSRARKPILNIADSIERFIQGAVTTGGDDRIETLLHCGCRESTRISRRGS